MLTKDIEQLNELKNQTNNFILPENDQDFVKLVTLKNVDSELRESLILLHSNYKTELKELKLSMHQIAYKILDKTENALKAVDIELKEKSNSGGMVSHAARNIAIIFGVVIIAFMILFIFAVIDPEAFKTASEALKSFMPSVFGIDKEILMQAPPAPPPTK